MTKLNRHFLSDVYFSFTLNRKQWEKNIVRCNSTMSDNFLCNFLWANNEPHTVKGRGKPTSAIMNFSCIFTGLFSLRKVTIVCPGGGAAKLYSKSSLETDRFPGYDEHSDGFTHEARDKHTAGTWVVFMKFEAEIWFLAPAAAATHTEICWLCSLRASDSLIMR